MRFWQNTLTITIIIIYLQTSIDHATTKTQAGVKVHIIIALKHCKYLNLFNYVCSKSCEKGIITKGHIVTHTHLNFIFELALYLSMPGLKLFNSDTKLF